MTPRSPKPGKQRKTRSQTSNKESIRDSDTTDSDEESRGGGYWLRIPVSWTEPGNSHPPERVPVREEYNQIHRREESRVSENLSEKEPNTYLVPPVEDDVDEEREAAAFVEPERVASPSEGSEAVQLHITPTPSEAPVLQFSSSEELDVVSIKTGDTEDSPLQTPALEELVEVFQYYKAPLLKRRRDVTLGDQRRRDVTLGDQRRRDVTLGDQRRRDVTLGDQRRRDVTLGDQRRRDVTLGDQRRRDVTLGDQRRRDVTLGDQRRRDVTLGDQRRRDVTLGDQRRRDYALL
ncbi:hypothetical protein DPX16_22709 [Anabarilius grahami]|uniref:Uncharacterized protein n=1 Tax=Anabarilius grahami TaxID=495550 RepID=A0A3N0XXD4_ANAGA|nr:hypothetical protein DPX16_22709 [Anabarilius grahami]